MYKKQEKNICIETYIKNVDKETFGLPLVKLI